MYIFLEGRHLIIERVLNFSSIFFGFKNSNGSMDVPHAPILLGAPCVHEDVDDGEAGDYDSWKEYIAV